MKSNLILFLVAAYSFTNFSSLFAEADFHSVGAATSAEAGLVIDSEIDWLTEYQSNTNSGSPYIKMVENAQLSRENGTCFADLDGFATASQESIEMEGVAQIGGAVNEPGPPMYLRTWVTANGFVNIGEGNSYRFSGHRTRNARVHFWLECRDTGEEILIRVNDESLDFEHSGAIPSTGMHFLQVALELMHVSSEISEFREELSFKVAIHPTGTVANEALSWGNIKSLYR
jgi:hypothetical protein